MRTAEQNYRLLREIEANRRLLLMAYQQNPKLLESAEMRIKQLFETPEHGADNNQSSVVSPQSAPRPPEGRASGGVPLAGASERGISLIELIMFIVIVSVALAGILLVMNVTTRGSVDPLIHKQALAIAESLLEEVELMPLTICDPNDANAASAVIAADCAFAANDESTPLGPEATEVRGSTTSPYDNVSDYNGFSMTGAAMQDIAGNSLAGLGGYTASVVVGNTGCAGIAFPDALTIAVTVTGSGSSIVLDGCRTRYSPRGVP